MTDIYKGNIPWIRPLPEGLVAEKFEVAARALIVFEGRALFVYEEATDLWWTPGGRLNPDEELHAACLREIDEETGLEVNLGALVASWSTITPRKGYMANKFEFIFVAAPVTPPDFIERVYNDADQSEEPVSKMRWFTAEEAAALPNIFPAFLRKWPALIPPQTSVRA